MVLFSLFLSGLPEMGEPTIALTSNIGTLFQFRRKDVTVSAFFREMLEEQDWEAIPVPFSDVVLGMAQKWFKEQLVSVILK